VDAYNTSVGFIPEYGVGFKKASEYPSLAALLPCDRVC